MSPKPVPGTLRLAAPGFSLVEVLVAVGVLAVAMAGVGVAVGVQSGGTSAAVDYGQAATSRGRAVSVATFLAQERIEQARRLRYTLGPPLVDELGSGSPPASLPDEGFGTIPGYPDFSRSVTVQNGVPTQNMKLLVVTMRFRRGHERGLVEESLRLRTFVAARP